MSRFPRFILGTVLLTLSTIPFAAESAVTLGAEKQLTRAQALKAVDNGQVETRVAAIERLAEVGTMSDVERLIARLRDENDSVRELAAAALWHIWSRSGDPEIDALYQQGIHQMQTANLDDALTTFSEIIQRKPQFAEAWNKRATILYMVGEHRKSLRDCDEALKRNPNHFGALSGMAQIHVILGQPEHALEAYERAVRINPNLPDAEENLRVLREAVAERRAKTV